jgi:hypothetical protein
VRGEERHGEAQLQLELLACPLLGIGKLPQGSDRACELVRRVAIRMALERVLRRVLAVLERAPRIAAVLEVDGELAGAVCRASTVRLFLARADTPVQLAPRAGWDPFVHDVPVERVHEPEPASRGAVGPAGDPARDQEVLPPRQRRALHLDGIERPREGGRDGRGRELGPGDARRLQHVLIVLGERVELALDHLSHVGRRLDRQPAGRRPPPTVAHKHTALDEVVDHVHHEERIALRAAMDGPGDCARPRRLRALEPPRDVFTHLDLVQERQADLLTLTVQPQLLHDRPQRMVVRERAGRTIGPDDEEARTLGPPGERREQLERRVIAPVQVLEHQHQRPLDGHRLDRIGQLAQHALVSRARVGRRAIGEHAGHLREPARRSRSQRRRQRRPVRRTAQPSEGLQHRQVRLAGPELLDALSVSVPQRIAREALAKRLEQRRLAYARLPADEQQSALSTLHPIEGRGEAADLGLPPDDARNRACRLPRRGLPTTRDRGDEAVATPVRGLDEARCPGVVPEGATDLEDRVLRQPPADMDAGPDGRQQLVGRHQPSGMLGEIAQHREGLRPEADRSRSTQQLLAREVEREGREDERRVCRHAGTGFDQSSTELLPYSRSRRPSRSVCDAG